MDQFHVWWYADLSVASPVESNLLKFVEQASTSSLNVPSVTFCDDAGNVCSVGGARCESLVGCNRSHCTFGLTTNNFVLFNAGHMSKLRAIAFFAPIVAGVILTYRGKLLWGGVLLVLPWG
ncbi:MAG: hypothetical protein R2769_05360 [Saprospiraceae bacterium]